MSYIPNPLNIVQNSDKLLSITTAGVQRTNFFQLTGRIILHSLFFYNKTITDKTVSATILPGANFKIIMFKGAQGSQVDGPLISGSLGSSAASQAFMDFTSASIVGHTFGLVSSFATNNMPLIDIQGNQSANAPMSSGTTGVICNGDFINNLGDRFANPDFNLTMSDFGQANCFIGIRLNSSTGTFSGTYDVIAMYTSMGGSLTAV